MLGRPLSSSALGSEQHAGPTTTNSTRVVEASSAIVQRGKGRLHYQKAKANAYRRRGLVGSCERCKLFNTATSRLSLPLGRTFGERGRGRGRGRGADAGKYSCRALQRENAEDSRIRETPIATDPVSKHQYQLVGSRKELIHVVVEESQSAFTVSIRVRNILIGEGTSVSLRWWTFNGTSNLAETKEEYLGACDSTKLAGNAFVSPFTRDSERDGEYFTRLVLRNKTTTSSSGPPATASFAQQLAFNPTYTFEGRPVLSRPREHNYFAIPLGFYPGTPFPLGAHRQDDWVNFTVLSAASTRPKLCFLQLDDKDGNSRGGVRGASIGVEIELDPTLNRTGDLWHCAVKVPKHFDAYAFRMAQVDPTDGYKIGEELLPDPFADDTVEVRVSNNQDREEDSDGDGDGGSGSRSRPVAFASASLLPPSGAGRGMEEKEEDAFLEAWEEDRPLKHAFSRAVILEMDLHKGEEGEARGDQEGEHVEELNVFEAVLSAALEVEDSGITALAVRGLINEETITSAASVAYGLGSQELKHLVRRLHEMDLELILELDCLKLLSVMRVAHLNEGRAIQSLKAGMRFLVSEYNLDGVCFLHAEKLTHGDFDIVLDRPPIVEDLCNDPVLHSTKLIAVPFGNHLLPREGLRGFPHWGRWAEVNSRFVEDMRNLYLADSRADLTRVSMRLAGSADLFEKWTNGSFHLFAERPPYLGLNSVSFVGELPLSEMKGASVQDAPSTERGGAALVEQKHADSIRWSLISSMMVSQGVPFLRLLDLSHENWPEELALFSRLCEFRERYFDLIQKETFRDPKDVRWHSIDAEAEPEWSSSAESKDGLGNSSFRAEGLSDLPFVAEACHHESKFIGLSIWSDDQMHAVYWAGNGNDTSLQIALPEPTLGHTWKILLDSGRIGLSLSNETLAASEEYPMEAKSSILLTMEKIA